MPRKAKATEPAAIAAAPIKIKNPHTCWSGVICFGLIPVPVKFHTGARKGKGIEWHQLHGDCHTQLKQQMFCPSCDSSVPYTDIVKGTEYSEGKWVIATKEEIDGCKLPTQETVDIQKFVKLSDIDPLLFESSYYVGIDKGGEKGWELIRRTLNRTGYAAIAKVTMFQREHVIVIRPYRDGMVAHTLFYEPEIAQMAFPASLPEPKPGELDVAVQLVEAYKGEFHLADYNDGYDVAMKGLVAAKAEGKPVEVRIPPQHAEAPVDLMEALKKSVAEAKARKKAA